MYPRRAVPGRSSSSTAADCLPERKCKAGVTSSVFGAVATTKEAYTVHAALRCSAELESFQDCVHYPLGSLRVACAYCSFGTWIEKAAFGDDDVDG